ncbi:glutathione S-transferase [Flagelloscypha sp. PMI_526]|nr:glutathione S-transferase [Flagelloscypha sp. PMI_526]
MSKIDTSLYPNATGAAATFAASHAKEHPLKLYAGWFCPFVQRSWMTLHEKRIPHQYVEINPYQKAPEFLALNPRGLVPTLAVPVDGSGKVLKPLYESGVVCEYLEEAFSAEDKHGPKLLPEDPYERARCRLWIDHITSRIVPRFYRFIQHTASKEYSLDEIRADFLAQIKTWVREMAASEIGPWFLGERFSLVDIMLAPWAFRLFLIDHYKSGGVGIPAPGEGGEDEVIWQRWRTWFTAMMDRQSLKDTLSDREAYIDVYKRYAEDTTMSEVAQATRAGQSLP